MKRGAVTEFHVANISGNVSRAFNAVEAKAQYQKLEKELEELKEQAEAKIAKKYLAYYRQLLKPFNTKNHVIAITAGMGFCCVTVDGENVEYFNYKKGDLTYLLAELNQALNYDWAWCLDGERLNEV